MIKRLINRIFGQGPTLQPAETQKPTAEAKNEPTDELVSEPGLPVEEGYTFTRQMGRRHNPKAPQLKAEELEHLWSGKKLYGQLRTDLSLARNELSDIESRDRTIGRLIERDQSKADFDQRVGHVVIPSREFEYHGDLKTVRFPETNGKGIMTGQVLTLATDRGTIHLDSQSGEYNYLPIQSPVVSGTDFSSYTKVTFSGEFAISDDGVIQVPTASTLEEAPGIADKRELALDTQRILDWAKVVSNESDYRVDGFENDHDPRPGHTVASQLDEYWFLRNASLPHMQHQTYSVESGPDRTRLYEDSHGKVPLLLLDMKTEGDVTRIEASLEPAKSIHIAWNKREQSVDAEVRQHKNFVEPQPKMDNQEPTPYRQKESPSFSRSTSPKPSVRDRLPRGFTKSNRIRSYGGGHHVMVTASGPFPNDQTYPKKFTDPDTGKTYRQSTYRVLDGSTLYIED